MRAVRLAPQGLPRDAEDAAVRQIRSGRLTQGERVREFEGAMHRALGLGPARSAIMVNSGSSANLLMAALLRRRLDARGDPRRDVLTPALTWSTTVWPLLQHGLRPVFVDIGSDLTLDPARVGEAIDAGTDPAAVLPVHLLGSPADCQALAGIAADRDAMLLEDCCEALWAESGGRMTGSWGHAASWSFYWSHHMTTVEGGLLAYPATERAPRAWREHGWTRAYPPAERAETESASPDIDPRFLFDDLGDNLRSNDVFAALGLAQLPMQRAWATRRRWVADWYGRRLAHPWLDQVDAVPGTQPNPFSHPIFVRPDSPFSRAELAEHLESWGIETRPVMSGDIRRHPWFLRNPGLWASHGDLPNTASVHERGLLLPIHHELSVADLEHVREALDAFLKPATGEGLA